MQTLFKTIDELRLYITVDYSQKEETILPYMAQAHKYIKDFIGDTTFDAVLAWYNATTPPATNSAYELLLEKIQLALANFGYMLAIPKINVNIGALGIGVVSNQNVAPASKERVDALKESCKQSGYDAIEELIKFIIANSADYADAYAWINNYLFFVNTATEVNHYTMANIRHWQFIENRPEMQLIERNKVLPILDQSEFDTIKGEMKSGTYTGDHSYIVNSFIKPACAFLFYYEVTEKEDFKREGERTLELLRQYLIDQTPDTEDVVERFENSADYSVFVG